jgi:hypothetical protein
LDLTATLQLAHAVAAKIFEKSNPTLAQVIPLTDAEAAELNKAITQLAAFYDLKPDPKTVAWFGFLSALSVVYGGKAVQYQMRVAMQQ